MTTILVVDDSLTDRQLIGGFLAKIPDYSIAYACDGLEALEQMKHQRPDLVVTDLIMPNMDGLQLVAAVVESYPLTPVVLVTGKGSEETAVKALQAGAASYVPKTLLGKLLTGTVEKVLAVAHDERIQAKLMDCMTRNDFRFALSNDATLIPPLVNYLHRSLREGGLCDKACGIRVSVALEEAMNNALYHGKLELPSTIRERDRTEYRQLVEKRLRAEPYRERKIHVVAKISRTSAEFVIRDEGPGFDPAALPDPTDPGNLEKASGRGLLLMRTFMDEVRFNQLGNEVTLVKLIPSPTAREAD
jgi:CheY-like chemotaxis protein/anti-sigma regulatory factor (Ser/Thr protein kinase)